MNPVGARTFLEREARLCSDLAALPDPQQRLSWVVDRARRRPPLAADQRTPARLVPGCAARLWLVAEVEPETACCRFAADSDSAILKAMAGMLCELYDGLPPSEVVAGEPGVFAATGLLGQLTENRRRTIARVREAIRGFARERATAGGA
jgi:cysteine desulfuration protein SufE